MNARRPLVATALVAALAGATVPAGAGATVPPRNCGALAVAHRDYIIKADQIRCSTAKADAKRYLTTRRKPPGYTCRDYKNTRMTFRCNKGIRVFFAIRR